MSKCKRNWLRYEELQNFFLAVRWPFIDACKRTCEFSNLGSLTYLCSLVLMAAGLLAFAPHTAWGADLKKELIRLASDEVAVRFDAAISLITWPDPTTAQQVSVFLDQEPFPRLFGESKEAKAALDFFFLKRDGKTVCAENNLLPNQMNIILISIDTLRADHLGCYGYQYDTSPIIDALALKGTVFMKAISPSSWTLPSHMSIFTSLYPSFHKVDKGGRFGYGKLDTSESTLAEILKSGGFTTVGLIAHPFIDARWGFSRGFDIYGSFEIKAFAQTKRAMLWMEWHQFHINRRMAEANFFLFLHYIDPHETYDPPPKFSKRYYTDYQGPLKPTDRLVSKFSKSDFETREDLRYVLNLYDGEVNYVDKQLGRLFNKLHQIGWEDSTLVVLTSDHGEEFKDHGSMGHKATLYGEQLRVPLIFTYPGKIEAGQKIQAQVSTLDILPTILELAGRPPLPKAQGVSLLSYLKKKDREQPVIQRDFFAELGPLGFAWEREFYRKAMQTERYKLIYNYEKDGLLRKELYDLRADPAEKVNIYDEKKGTEETHKMEKRFDAFIRDGLHYKKGIRSKNTIEVDEQTQERLRALGYMQ